MRSFLVAVAFLTVLPIRFREAPDGKTLAASRFFYPVVGLILGVLFLAPAALASRLPSSQVAAFLILLLWVGLTGALHLDGFCDVCDGLFGGATLDERLRIMKDPHLGTFGLTGGVLLLLGKFVMLSELLRRPGGAAIVECAVAIARCLTLSLAAGARYPRAEGTGKFFVESVRWPEAVAGVLLAAAVAGLTTSDPLSALTVLGTALLSVFSLRWFCQRRLGGITGDCLGAGIELTELIVLLTGVMIG